MGQLSNHILQAIREQRYAFGVHANIRLRQRRILGRHVIAGMDMAKVLLERSDGVPHPVAEFEISLPDGTPVKAVWAWISQTQEAKLVTVHFFPRAASWE
jgi:hypothetical protein